MQVPQDEVDPGIAVEDINCELLEFLNGVLRGSQPLWATMDKEGFAIMSTLQWLEYLLWGGVRSYADHRNLACILHPRA